MKYTFFWGGYQSNWYSSPFTHQGVNFNCSEQAMMYQKALLFKDNDTAQRILRSKNPKDQKRLGREVSNFNPKEWDDKKQSIMVNILFDKFNQNPGIKEKLLKDKCDLFVEASPYDRIWGIGYLEKDALKNINNWGENLLGLALTEVREILKTK